MNTIIKHFYDSFKPFKKISAFSDNPGVYAFHFIGKKFPLDSATNAIKNGQIIYIGKTESSQKDRDADTHFKSGQSGRSTVRRSIGAIMCKEYNLVPISRNPYKNTEQDIRSYMFDDNSESIITEWMKSNLGISFHPMPCHPSDIYKLETILIEEVVPLLNIAKNQLNPYKLELQQLRKQCAEIVASGIELKEPVKRQQKVISTKLQVASTSNPVNLDSAKKYVPVWQKLQNEIKNGIEECIKNGIFSMVLHKEWFTSVGNRELYAFNIQYSKGIVQNDLGGSAVARDLDYVLRQSDIIRLLLEKCEIKIRMSSKFILIIDKL